MPRDDDDFDDEEYRPRKRGGERRGTPVGVAIGLAVVAVVILGAVAILVTRNRQAADQARHALAENEAQIAREVAGFEKAATPVEKSQTNWEKVIGTWVREPGPKDADRAPYRFEFRKGRVARTVRTGFDGQVQDTEGRVTVMADGGNLLTIRQDVTGGTMTYRFQLMEDGALSLISKPGDVRFARLK